MNQWKIGDVLVTRIVEMEVLGGTKFILPDATKEACLPIEWMKPNFMKINRIMHFYSPGILQMNSHPKFFSMALRAIL